MKKLTIILTALALVMVGTSMVIAQDLPQALTGVNLSTAQVLTPDQAQQVRGAFNPGNGIPQYSGPPDHSGQGRSRYYNAFDTYPPDSQYYPSGAVYKNSRVWTNVP